jgi:hypothetical protein
VRRVGSLPNLKFGVDEDWAELLVLEFNLAAYGARRILLRYGQ